MNRTSAGVPTALFTDLDSLMQETVRRVSDTLGVAFCTVAECRPGTGGLLLRALGIDVADPAFHARRKRHVIEALTASVRAGRASE